MALVGSGGADAKGPGFETEDQLPGMIPVKESSDRSRLNGSTQSSHVLTAAGCRVASDKAQIRIKKGAEQSDVWGCLLPMAKIDDASQELPSISRGSRNPGVYLT